MTPPLPAENGPVEPPRSGDEPRTAREGREAIRELEAALERVHMSPVAVIGFSVGWYLRKARLALRQAERHLADADDPRLPPLKALRAQISERRIRLGADGQPLPRRRRHRCPLCFYECLAAPGEAEEVACRRSACVGTMEPVARLPRGAA